MDVVSLKCQTVARESLLILKDSLKLSAVLPDFMRPTIRSAVVEALGAWRAEAILGPAPTITIRKPPRYTANWMGE